MGSGLARHWLALFILGVGVFSALPIAAPLLSLAGRDRAASAIYVAYRVTCHQLPHRSWFIAGRDTHYDWDTVSAYMGFSADDREIQAFHKPIRDPELGYQVAYCQRDTATWMTLWAAAVAYAAVRHRRRIKALPIWAYLLALVPLAVDGGIQMLGIHESTPLNRTVTGALFGGATAWLILPMLDSGMRDIQASQERRKARQQDLDELHRASERPD
jgi:uncharacterized membrane protein